MEKDLILHLVGSLVDEPSQIEINEIVDGDSITIELKVAQSDLGKVIGKQGRIAKALRTILSAGGAKAGKRVNLEILD